MQQQWRNDQLKTVWKDNNMTWIVRCIIIGETCITGKISLGGGGGALLLDFIHFKHYKEKQIIAMVVLLFVGLALISFITGYCHKAVMKTDNFVMFFWQTS